MATVTSQFCRVIARKLWERNKRWDLEVYWYTSTRYCCLLYLLYCPCGKQCDAVALMNSHLPVQRKQLHNEHTHGEHSQDFLAVIPAHNEAKGLFFYLQRVKDGAWCFRFEPFDVLMGDLKPLGVGIRDLRRGSNHTGRVSVASHLTVMFVLSSCASLFLARFVPYSVGVKHALIKYCFWH